MLNNEPDTETANVPKALGRDFTTSIFSNVPKADEDVVILPHCESVGYCSVFFITSCIKVAAYRLF